MSFTRRTIAMLWTAVTTALIPAAGLAQRPSVVLAQRPPDRPLRSVHVGDTVRVLNARRWVTGALVALSVDSVVIAELGQPQPQAYRIGEVQTIEVYRGRHGHAVTGVSLGMTAGALAGYLIGRAVAANDSWSFAELTGPLVGAPAGALLGGIAGALIRTDRWVPVSRAPVRVSVAPMHRGFRFGLSVSLPVTR